MFKNAREHDDLLKQVRKSDDGTLPKNMLFKSKSEIKTYIDMFRNVKDKDAENEKFPHAVHKRRSTILE